MGNSDDERCSVCGETRLEGWEVCPACGHPYDDLDDDGEGGWWRAR